MVSPLRTELNPEVQEAVRELNRVPSPPQIPIDHFRREKQRRFRNREHQPPRVASVQDFLIPQPEANIPIRVYRPVEEGTIPVLIWLHGGGWAHGNMDMTDTTARWLSNEVGCAVVAVEYRLSPEHKFPAALKDTYATLRWISEYPELIQGDPDRIAVGGTSAGSNLAAAVSLLARDDGGPSIAFQMLAVPITNVASFDTDSYQENEEGYGLTRDGMRFYAKSYVRDEFDRRNPYVSPLLAHDLTGLPPAFVLTAGFDPLRDEGIAYAERLSNAGVSVDHVHYPDTSHYIRQHRNQGLTRGIETFEDITQSLRDGLQVDS